MSIETLEKTFEKTIKVLSNLSLYELRELV